MKATTTIQKWGNSYAVRLPTATIKKLNLRAGTPVRIGEIKADGSLAIIPVAVSALDLRDLVARISPANHHRAVEWGQNVGKEVW